MAAYYKHTAGEDGYSEWIQPVRKGYKLACCDCGLVHNVDFRTQRGKIQFRVSRNERSTAAVRREKAKKMKATN